MAQALAPNLGLLKFFPGIMDTEYVKSKVRDALDAQFELYSWQDMIEDCDLTPEEEEWAKEHLTYDVVEC